MKPELITIGKRKWLLGMEWDTLKDAPDIATLKLNAASGNPSIPNRNWVVSRLDENAIQAGYCVPIGDGKTKGVYSLAATIADLNQEPWLGTFCLSEKDDDPDALWWCVAVRGKSHAILPDGDIVGTKAEIFEQRKLYASIDEWNFVDGNILDLARLIEDSEHKPVRVRNITDKRIPLPVACGLGAVAVIALVVSYIYYRADQEEKRLHALAVIQAAQKKVAVKRPQIDPSYISTPAPLVWLAACRDVLGPLPLSESGWSLADVGCNPTSVTSTWSREKYSTIEMRPQGALSDDLNTVKQVLPLRLPGSKSGLDLPVLTEGKSSLQSWAQRSGLSITFSQPSMAATLPGAKEPAVEMIPRKLEFSFTLMSSPFDIGLADELSTIPGLRLTGLVRSVREGDSSNGDPAANWSVKGVIYGS